MHRRSLHSKKQTNLHIGEEKLFPPVDGQCPALLAEAWTFFQGWELERELEWELEWELERELE